MREGSPKAGRTKTSADAMNGDDGEDGARPLTFWRAIKMPEFWMLLVTSGAGAAGGAWWMFIPLCVAGLSISSLPKYISLWPRARDAGAERAWWETVGLSIFNNAGAASAAFMLGIGSRWLFS